MKHPNQKIKNAILIGIPYHNYVNSISLALNDLGVKTWSATNKFHHPLIKYLPLVSGMLGKLVDTYHKRRLMRLILKHGREADLLILWGIYIFTERDLRRIRGIEGLTTVFWYIDSVYTFDQGLNLPEYFDFILCYNQEDAKHLENLGHQTMFVPLAFDAHKYYPITGEHITYDIYFIGSLRNRIEYLERLLMNLTDLKLRIRIDGPLSPLFLFLKRKRYPNFLNHYSGQSISHENINLVYNRTNLCLNLQPAQATSGFSIRTFEIYGAGRLQLTNGNHSLLSEIFGDDDHIQYFRNFEELQSSIRSYFGHRADNQPKPLDDTKRMKHSFYSRTGEILRFLEERI